MQKSLYWKITLALVLVAFTSAALVAAFIRLTSVDRLARLILDQQGERLEQTLVAYYTTQGSWDGLNENWRRLTYREVFNDPLPGQEDHLPGARPSDRRNLFGLADAKGLVVVPYERDMAVGTKIPGRVLKEGIPIVVENQQVGTLLVATREPGFNPAEDQFLQRTNQALLWGILGALVVAVVMGILLASTLTRPLHALTRAAQNIAQGHLEQQVEVHSKDEVGQLAEAFNRMSQEVARANQLRRQMTADIAHDLRTPLTVIGGYVESMRDGVLQPTPARMTLIYTEIERLQRLVGDLRMLTQADAGELPLHPQPLEPALLLERAAELFRHHAEQQEVTLAVEAAPSLPEVMVDEARMMQVMDNLIGNALRYTPAGGSITLSAQAQGGKVILAVRDTGQGIAPEDLPFIFNRFHRADKSRHTETGESGLGLSIVKALVEAQHGRVWAESELGQGTSVMMEFMDH